MNPFIFTQLLSRYGQLGAWEQEHVPMCLTKGIKVIQKKKIKRQNETHQ